jgi:hypothetical protein
MKNWDKLAKDLFFILVVGTIAYANVVWGVIGLLNTILLCWAVLMYFSVLSDYKDEYARSFFTVIFSIWALKSVLDILQIEMSSVGVASSIEDNILRFGIAPFAAFIIATISVYRQKLHGAEEHPGL